MKCREKEKKHKKEQSITEIYDNFKRPNIHITGFYEGGV